MRKKVWEGPPGADGMGCARASAYSTLWEHHVQAGGLRQAVGGVGGKCARACSSAAGVARGGAACAGSGARGPGADYGSSDGGG